MQLSKQKGFTLVEIAIVLVIVGLLIGGVLKGQEMITNAKLKRVESDNAGIAAAMFSYQDRYLQLPGDDDQAVYAFQAASPEWIGALARSPDWETRVLGQSWRCPEAVRAAAVRVIARCADRVPKAYAARPEVGIYAHCPTLDEAVQVASRAPSAFVLARSHTGCTTAARTLLAAGIPYVAERGRGPNPFGQPSYSATSSISPPGGTRKMRPNGMSVK